jgi:hypothetical protein
MGAKNAGTPKPIHDLLQSFRSPLLIGIRAHHVR